MAREERIIRFGNDGWQARFEDAFTDENVARLTEAIGLAWAETNLGAKVYVGYDTRYRSRAFAEIVAGVVGSCGLRAVLSKDYCPTPAVAWACARDADAVGAIIITASSRSAEYGGILVRGADGSECPRAFLDEVEDLVSPSASSVRGSFSEQDFVQPYMDNLAEHADVRSISAAKPKVVVDPMYGSARGYAARLLERVGCEVEEIHAEPFADFGSIHPEPADPWADKCAQAVMAHGADIGLLLDGDGDRSAVIDEKGRLLTPQHNVALILDQLVEGRGAQGRVVTTLSSSALVRRLAEALGQECTEVPVGFSRLYREMLEGDVILAAEEYGGIGVPEHLLERDGLLACLIVVELVARTGRRVSELVDAIEAKAGRSRYTRRDLRLDSADIQTLRIVLPGFNPKEIAGKVPVDVSHADGLRLGFADGSWVLIRPSRTESIVRVYSEASSEHDRDAALEAACSIIKAGI